MRKIVLAAAVATSALALAACGETAESVAESGEAMADGAVNATAEGVDAVEGAVEEGAELDPSVAPNIGARRRPTAQLVDRRLHHALVVLPLQGEDFEGHAELVADRPRVP